MLSGGGKEMGAELGGVKKKGLELNVIKTHCVKFSKNLLILFKQINKFQKMLIQLTYLSLLQLNHSF